MAIDTLTSQTGRNGYDVNLKINGIYIMPTIFESLQWNSSVLQIRYRPNAPLVLKGINYTFKGGKRVGVVG